MDVEIEQKICVGAIAKCILTANYEWNFLIGYFKGNNFSFFWKHYLFLSLNRLKDMNSCTLMAWNVRQKKTNISVLQTQHVLFVRCWDVSDIRYLILKIKNADTSFSLAKEIFSHGKSRIFDIHHARICCASLSSRRKNK